MDMAPDVGRTALIVYGRSVLVPVTLGGYNELAEFLVHLEGIAYSKDLGTPQLSAAYRAILQQYKTFGRSAAHHIVIVFSSGEDIYPLTNTKELREAGAQVVMVAPEVYEAETQDESTTGILLGSWNELEGSKVVDRMETDCAKGVLKLKTELLPTAVHTPEPTLLALASSTADFDTCKRSDVPIGVILAVETSERAKADQADLKNRMMRFVKTHYDPNFRIGIVYYGTTVEVSIDVGNYDDQDELEEAVEFMHFVGGEADAVLALSTASQMFAESKKYQGNLKFVVHVHTTPLSPEAYEKSQEMRYLEDITVLNVPRSRWSSLEDPIVTWRERLCNLHAH
ncbi:Immunoglobulin I-set domain containing protein, partial [Aphelenchoides avenae]